MEPVLKQIYRDVASGKLSQHDALEKIKAIKLQQQNRADVLLATPVWQAGALPAGLGLEYAEHHVFSLQVSEHQDLAQSYREAALACFERIRTIFQGKPQGRVLVQIVSSEPLFAGLSGMLKTATLENPDFTGQVLLVPPGMTADERDRLLEEERSHGLDPLVRYEDGLRRVVRWQEIGEEHDLPPVPLHDGDVYLITGGLGALGLLFAKEILDRTSAARVVLTGRAEKPGRPHGLSRATYRQVDLSDYGQVEELIAGVRNEYGRLDGILHGAGMIADNFILKKDSAEFSAVLAPKVTGTFHLDRASVDVNLDFFVLFSSFASAMGNAGQVDYAAANGFMDQFASHRNRQVEAGHRRGRTRSIHWPLWQAGGMRFDPASLALLQQTTGLQPMQTATGLQAFHRSLALPYDQVLVLEGDRAQMRRALLAAPALQSGAPAPSAPRPKQPQPVASIDSDGLVAKTRDFLRGQFSILLKLPAHRIESEAALEQYGIDSILAMKLTTQLEQTFGKLSKTLFFEYQSIADLTEYFVRSHSDRLTELFQAPAAEAPAPVPATARPKGLPSRRPSRPEVAVSAAAPAPAAESDRIAIIGLSGRYPASVDLEAYWRNLRDGKDCIVEVPKNRWDWQEYFSADRTRTGHHYSKWGGFIAGVDEFDPLFFNIPPRDAKYIDPQERLFLQHAWMAIEDAGYTRASLQVPADNDLAGQVGVYAGLMYTEYQLFGAEAAARDERLGIMGSAASIANRVSYALNLHGPSMTLDTMCSSSLTAIHLACQDLKLGRTSLAIAGGVNVSIHPNKYLVLSRGQFISSDGHCQSFGEGGDGYIPGEGVGVVVLKRLSEAERDGDHIYAVIRGSALNHGGKTNGYTVPNPQAQASAISRALAESGTDARQISYIEAHGTGTKLGDPIEIAALNRAFERYTRETGFCRIGSVKSNIGHCESAAGVAGLTKVLLQMEHQEIVPSLHSAQLNPHIDFPSSPFVVNQSLTAWEQPVVDGRKLPRIAGISSFGAGGSNAHVIVEEYEAPAQQTQSGPVAILLSARTAEQLQQKAVDLLEFLRPRLKTIDPISMAYTLQVGREVMDERLGFVVSSAEELVAKLQAHLAGEEGIEDAYQGQAKRNKEALAMFSTDGDLQETIDKWIAGRKLPKLLDLWARGLDLDWRKLYGEATPRRISLPTYPFAREHYWIDPPAAAGAAAVTGAATSVLHPLLHSNTSDFDQQSYSSTFRGDESFLKDGILRPAAYLEMARAAVERAAKLSSEQSLELRDVVWAEPFASSAGPLSVALFANEDGQIDWEIYSGNAEQNVHCQGRAIVADDPAPARLDLDQLERESGAGQSLVRLRLPQAEQQPDYVLHPALLDGALEAALGDQARVPAALESLRLLSSPASSELVAWVRPAPGGQAVDIDLSDVHGNVFAQLRGLRSQQAVPASARNADAIAPPAAAAAPPPVRRELVFSPQTDAAPVPVERKKRGPVSLAAPGGAMQPAPASSSGRARVTLAAPGGPAASAPAGTTAAGSPVRLLDRGDGVFSIEIAASTRADVIAHLRQALDRIRQEASLKVLMLNGLEHCFWRRGREEYNDALQQKLFQALVSFPSPVIAGLQGDVIGSGFLAAALCDFIVCSEDAAYGYTNVATRFYPTVAETIVFSERFGPAQAEDLLYRSATSTGRQLRAKGWTSPVLPAAQVEAHAQELASTLATKPQAALRFLKQNLTRRLGGLVDALTAVDPATTVVDQTAGTVALVRFGNGGIHDLPADLSRHAAIVLLVEDSDVPEHDVADLQRLIVESPIPVVAALPRDAKGNAWLIGQFCDAAVHSRTGSYSAEVAPALAPAAVAYFTHRLGDDAAREVLLTGAAYSGLELQRRTATAIVTAAEDVLPAAMHLAGYWTSLPQNTLAGWKQYTATTLQEKIRSLAPASAQQRDDVNESPAAPAAIPLRSKVVTATAHPDGIVVVRMEDREARNMFSEAFIEGVTEAFAEIAQNPACKVVILTGYDNYFAAGGTKESLLAIQEGKVRFTDVKIFQLPLDCRIPVIAAMQGHGIGAGWTMGMFADLAIMSEESRYASPYMSYGFTPGAGATWILAERLGTDLARESLFTGGYYPGAELKERGLRLPILPRSEVLPAAMALAARIARAPRSRLIELKRQLTHDVREAVDETYRLELEMHEQTFVGQSDTLARIQLNFDADAEPRPASAPAAISAPAPRTPPKPTDAPPARTTSDPLPAVMATLRTLLAGELQMREDDIDDQTQFVDLGLDSISGVTWIRKINEKYQTSVEATKVYSYPTLAELSRHVRDEAEKQGTLSPPVAAPAPIAESAVPDDFAMKPAAAPRISRRSRSTPRPVAAAAPPTSRQSDPIAIVGMAGQFPQAKDIDEFWQNIAQGRDCISEVPSRRWDVSTYYEPGNAVPGKTNSQWLGALNDYDQFDPLFFNISPTEAEFMDPQQRLFLQACWHTIENAGYDARSLSGSKCGVFVGCAAGDYQQLSRRHQLSAQGFTGNAMSILAARISYFLNLQGPCVSIDTACSSSLVAIAQACDSLLSGGSDLALAGGVYVMAGPEMHIRTAQAAMLSAVGRCFTFDQRADGFVPGEGAGVILLKRLADAERDRDIIHGVIEGWGVNQDGKTNGITAPNPESQTRLMQEVYEKYEIDPADIQLIEAHGTATKLGDPIEVEGLKTTFRKYTTKQDYCALGSVKSNIGHCLTAAGIAGVIKLLLALKHRQLPPTIHFERLNEHIDLKDSPFFVNDRLQEWKLDGAERRLSAVSSFGFSGTNAHIVIGEYSPPVRVKPPAPAKTIVPLSARTADQLRQKARDLLDFLRRDAGTDLADIAYTLQVGRQPMDERLGFVVGSTGQLAEKLEAYAAGETGIEATWQGRAKRGRGGAGILGLDDDVKKTIVDKWIAEQELAKVLELWVEGLEVDWHRLYGDVEPQRVVLPGYPFADEHYWIEMAASEAVSPVSPPAPPPATAAAHRDTTGEAQTAATADTVFAAPAAADTVFAAPAAADTVFAAPAAAGTVFAAPFWQVSHSAAIDVEYAEHHVVLCDLPGPGIEALLPRVQLLTVASAQSATLAERYSDYAVGCFELVQTILQRKPRGRVLVQIMVRDEEEQVLLAGLTGLLKTAALENPQFSGQVVLVPPLVTTEELVRLVEEETNLVPETLVRYEGGARQVLRWKEIADEQEPAPMAFREDAVYLITGGLGSLGTIFANEILRQTRHSTVVLTGRSPFTAEIASRLAAWSPQVHYVQVNLGDREDLHRLIASIRQEHGRLDGILHCAGVHTDSFIVKKGSAAFRDVLAPKVTGTLHLDEATAEVELDFFVLFASIAGAVGNVGQADYATANAFLDQFAAYRNRQVAAKKRHGRTRSIDWPLWASGGMAIDAASQELVRQTMGVQPMDTATGLQAFYRSLALPYDQTLVVEGTRDRITSYLQKARIFEPQAVPVPKGAPRVQPAVNPRQLQQEVRQMVAAVVGIEASAIDADQPFSEYGLDSFLGAELIVAVNKKYGTELSHSRLFDYSTVREFSTFLEPEVNKLMAQAAPPTEAPAPEPRADQPPAAAPVATVRQTVRREARAPERSDEKIAIIGMSGRYPQASDLNAFWKNLVEGRNSVVEVPRSRWDVDRYYDPVRPSKDKTYSKWLGALDDVDRFDPLFFRISPQEAAYMDPQHRLFLQESYRAFEDAGYSTVTLSNKRCGVYLGISTNDYMTLLSRNGILSAPVTSNSYAIAAARIAYYLNLKGPAISIDTACSSSLVAIHLASQAILNREIDMAVAGGVTLWLAPESYVAMSQAGMFSPVGQCKTFDDSADGIVNGEGVGAVVLKRLSDAEEDGDVIYGVILGSAINQDGRTNGITAPSVNSQIELERSLYARHEIDPETIGYVEAHGTGTKLGDPIELEALATVFKEKTARKNFCALGSAKSNIGHTTSAAGVAGLQKVLLSMRNRTLVPSLNVTKENSRFDFENSPFYISRETKAWDVAPGTARRAALSSFGFSGTNAHLVIEEYLAPADQSVPAAESGPFLVPLSARAPEQLRQKARDLLDFLRHASQPVSLASLAYTLQVGREPMEERLGFVVSSIDELTEKLAAYGNGAKAIDGVHQGHVEPGGDGLTFIGGDDDMQEAIDKWIARKKLAPLLDLWTRGLNFDWNRLHGEVKPRRISLPTYPFAKERCWIDEPTVSREPASPPAADADLQSIADILEQIENDSIDTEHAVHALRTVVGG